MDSNRKRYERGAAVAAAYRAENYGNSNEEEATIITDLISDLLHVGWAHALRPAQLLGGAQDSFDGDSEDGPYQPAYGQALAPITVTIPACNPDTLLDKPSPVSIRNTGTDGGAGGAVMFELTGPPRDVHRFIASGWGTDEANDYVAI